MANRYPEPASPTSSGRKTDDYRGKNSAEIEKEIEATLQQIDRSLSAIEDRLNLQRSIDPIKQFFASPPGKALMVATMVTFASRKPILAFAIGTAYLYYRKKSERAKQHPETYEKQGTIQWKEETLSRKLTGDKSGQSPHQRDQEPPSKQPFGRH